MQRIAEEFKNIPGLREKMEVEVHYWQV